MPTERELPAVLAVAGDPGGANAVGPVVLELLAAGRRVRALAYRQACEVWKRLGVPFEKLPEVADVDGVRRRFREAWPDLLLTGTSCNGIDLEKAFLAAARDCGAPSLAVLDFWSNYRARFADEHGALSCLPDRIAVMDEWARGEMIAAGFDARRLAVTGQPAFDALAAFRARATPAYREAVRGGLGVGPGERLVLFASQPLARLYGEDPADPRFLGYTEHTVLEALVRALDGIGRCRAEPITLLIRPHPRERAEDLVRHRGRATRVVVDDRGDGRDAALAADVVAGMTTVLLYEACLMRCVVVSLQPGLRSEDSLPTNRRGASRAVYREDEIEGVVESLLVDREARAEAIARASGMAVDAGAAGRVVQALDALAESWAARESGATL
jgi:hypothetical protein